MKKLMFFLLLFAFLFVTTVSHAQKKDSISTHAQDSVAASHAQEEDSVASHAQYAQVDSICNIELPKYEYYGERNTSYISGRRMGWYLLPETETSNPTEGRVPAEEQKIYSLRLDAILSFIAEYHGYETPYDSMESAEQSLANKIRAYQSYKYSKGIVLTNRGQEYDFIMGPKVRGELLKDIYSICFIYQKMRGKSPDVTDSLDFVDSLDVSDSTISCPQFSFDSISTTGYLGTLYQDTASVDSAGKFNYEVLSGNLPTGISLDTATGELSGMLGTFNFTIGATDANGCVDSASYSIAFSYLKIKESDKKKKDKPKNIVGRSLCFLWIFMTLFLAFTQG